MIDFRIGKLPTPDLIERALHQIDGNSLAEFAYMAPECRDGVLCSVQASLALPLLSLKIEHTKYN